MRSALLQARVPLVMDEDARRTSGRTHVQPQQRAGIGEDRQCREAPVRGLVELRGSTRAPALADRTLPRQNRLSSGTLRVNLRSR